MSKTTLADYTYFKEDVLKHMHILIKNYELDVYEDSKGIWGLFVWLENDVCKIFLDVVSGFPQKEVLFNFYNKKNKEFFDSNKPYKLFMNYGICENEFKEFSAKLYDDIDKTDEDSFNEYRKSLIINEQILLKYYMPILDC